VATYDIKQKSCNANQYIVECMIMRIILKNKAEERNPVNFIERKINSNLTMQATTQQCKQITT